MSKRKWEEAAVLFPGCHQNASINFYSDEIICMQLDQASGFSHYSLERVSLSFS